jgi:hypothetical protein
MKALLCSAILALSAVAMPAAATPQAHTPRSQSGLPPGCWQIYPGGPIFCVDMPIGP